MDILEMLSKIDRLLKERTPKMSKADFYKACDITASAVSQWRSGKTQPARSTLEKMANVLDVSVEELTEEKTPATVHEGGLSERAKEIGRAFDAAAPELQKVIESALAGASAVVPDVVKIKITCPINQTEQVIYQPVYRIGNKVLPERGNNGCEMCHPCEECRICRLRAAASLLDGNAE